MDLVDDNTNTTCKSSLVRNIQLIMARMSLFQTSTTRKNIVPSFTIWEEGKEEEKKKPRLMLRKELIRDGSVEVTISFKFVFPNDVLLRNRSLKDTVFYLRLFYPTKRIVQRIFSYPRLILNLYYSINCLNFAIHAIYRFK